MYQLLATNVLCGKTLTEAHTILGRGILAMIKSTAYVPLPKG